MKATDVSRHAAGLIDLLADWEGWVAALSIVSLAAALLTWNGWVSILPVVGTMSVAYGSWTNNAKKIRVANLAANAPCMQLSDVLVKSWSGALNEGVTIISIVIFVIRFGWKSMDSNKIGK